MSESTVLRWRWTLLVAVVLVVAFSFEGSRGLWGTTEARYAECAREMLETGNYIEPTLGYQPHWTKPPVTHWAIAGSMAVLGQSEWGVRFPVALAFVFTALAVGAIGVALWDTKTGLLACLIFSTSLLPVAGGFEASTDMFLTLWVTLAMLCVVKAWRCQSPLIQRRWATTMWVFWGLGFLTKGPVALLPLVAVLVWRRWASPRFRLVTPEGLALFAVVGLGWYILVCLRNPGLLTQFLTHEVLGHSLTTASGHNHEWYQPFILYLPALTVGLGLWLPFAAMGFWHHRLWAPREVLQRVRGGGAGSLLLLWLLLPLAVFFVAKSRLLLYVLPLFAPIALATARWIVAPGEHFVSIRRVLTVAAASVVLIIASKGVFSHLPSDKDNRPLFEVCRRIGGDHLQVVAYKERRLYGLQFYLDGQMMRTTEDGDDSWADISLEEAIRAIQQSGAPDNWVVISDDDHETDVEREFDHLGIAYHVQWSDGWRLFTPADEAD